MFEDVAREPAMRLFIASAIFIVVGGSAQATGGISCEAEDRATRIRLDAGVTSGMGAPIFAFAGKTEISDERVPADLRTTDFAREHVAQYWLDNQELKLLLYREREDAAEHGYVEATVTTRGDGAGTYKGDYALTAYTVGRSGEGTTISLRGKILCEVE